MIEGGWTSKDGVGESEFEGLYKGEGALEGEDEGG